MSVKVKVQLDQAKLKQLHQSHLQALEMTAQSTLDDIKLSQVVPKDTSALEDSGFVDPTGINWGYTRIIFDTPYARRLYYHPGYDFRDDKNPNAQGEWMQAYIDGPKENFIRNAYAENLKMLARGIIK
ncbi:hypothetical protein [Turicibacter sanguinis]|uniref:hypothetical protein n=1 Tax=Turicibacter sanguinis TaxID=154288 RepID=UPI0018A92ABD|nr:hypothetical protein [Turicibacter sanguinis]MDB8553987.1 hypothetical protein [Turicibacter sanguinis]